MKVSPLPPPLPPLVSVGFEVLVVVVLNWNEKVVEKEAGVSVRGSNRRIGEEWIARPARWRKLVVSSGGIWMQDFWSEKMALPKRLMSWWILGFLFWLKSGKERYLVTLITGPLGIVFFLLLLLDSICIGLITRMRTMMDMIELKLLMEKV